MIVCPLCGSGYDRAAGDAIVPTYRVCRHCVNRTISGYVPPLFQATNRDRLPRGPLEQVLKWDGKRGLLLVGPSGAGKTRCMWELVKERSILDAAFFDCVSFGHTLSRKYRDGAAEDWLDDLGCHRPVVFFDDLGKLKLTERVEAELFGVIDRRCAMMLPIIATTQLEADALTQSMSDNRGAAMVRRLREACSIVQF